MMMMVLAVLMISSVHTAFLWKIICICSSSMRAKSSERGKVLKRDIISKKFFKHIDEKFFLTFSQCEFHQVKEYMYSSLYIIYTTRTQPNKMISWRRKKSSMDLVHIKNAIIHCAVDYILFFHLLVLLEYYVKIFE